MKSEDTGDSLHETTQSWKANRWQLKPRITVSWRVILWITHQQTFWKTLISSHPQIQLNACRCMFFPMCTFLFGENQTTVLGSFHRKSRQTWDKLCWQWSHFFCIITNQVMVLLSALILGTKIASWSSRVYATCPVFVWPRASVPTLPH